MTLTREELDALITSGNARLRASKPPPPEEPEDEEKPEPAPFQGPTQAPGVTVHKFQDAYGRYQPKAEPAYVGDLVNLRQRQGIETEQARDQSKTEVQKITERSETRRNALVLKDTEEAISRIQNGDTWMARMMGLGPTEDFKWYNPMTYNPLSRFVSAVTGTPEGEPNPLQKLYAPYWAIAQPGYTAGDMDDGETKDTAAREHPAWWLLRASAALPVMAYLLDDRDDLEWGSKEHIKKLQNYDYFDDRMKVGQWLWDLNIPLQGIEAIARKTEMASEKQIEMARTIGSAFLGSAGVVGLAIFDPDVTMGLSLFGKAAKGVKQVTGSLTERGVIRPVEKVTADLVGKIADDATNEDIIKLGEGVRKKFGVGSQEDKTFQVLAHDTVVQIAEEGGGTNISVKDLGNLLEREKKAEKFVGDVTPVVARAENVLGVVENRAQVAIEKLAAYVSTVNSLKKWTGKAVRAASVELGAKISYPSIQETLSYVQEIKVSLKVVEKRIAKLTGQLKSGGTPKEIESWQRQLLNELSTRRQLVVRGMFNAASGAHHSILAKVTSLTHARDTLANELAVMGTPRDELLKAVNNKAVQEALEQPYLAEVAANTEVVKGKKDILAAAQRRHKAILSAPQMLKDAARRLNNTAKIAKQIDREGKLQILSFVPAKSLTQAYRKVWDQDAYLREVFGRYGTAGDELAREAIRPGAPDFDVLMREEAIAFRKSEVERLDPAKEVLALRHILVEGRAPPASLSLQYASQWLLRALRTISRTTDGISERGLYAAPEEIRMVLNRSIHRVGSSISELDTVVSQYGMEKVWDEYLTTTKALPLERGHKATTWNRRRAPTEGLFKYLQLIGRAPEEDFVKDHVVEALTNAWQPPSHIGLVPVSQVRKNLYEFANNPQSSHEGIRAWFDGQQEVWKKDLYETEVFHRARRDLISAVVHGANFYETILDYQRATSGLKLTRGMAEAMNFMANPAKSSLKKALGAMREVDGEIAKASLDPARLAAANLGIPLLQTARGIMEGVEDQGRLLRLVGEDTKGPLFMPEVHWQALQSIPSKIAKELAQMHETGSVWSSTKRTIQQGLRVWKLNVLFGFVGRPAMFLRNEFGDWANMALGIGFIPATRLTAQHFMTNIPFIGMKGQNKLSDAARHNNVLSAFFDPNLAAVLRGDDVMIETADGPIHAIDFGQRAQEYGAYDAVGTEALEQATERVKSTKSWARQFGNVLALQDTTPFTKAVAKFFEETQYRNRLAFMIEASTGRLTGKPLTMAEAGKLLKLTLYDYRAGPTKLEMEFLGNIAAFWVYRRNMLKQLGAVLTEPLTHPSVMKTLGHGYAVNRLYTGSQVAMNAPDFFDWRDPDDDYTTKEYIHEALGRTSAPWWVKNANHVGNIPIVPERKEFHKQLSGVDATHEAIVLHGNTWADMLHLTNLMLQTVGATAGNMGLFGDNVTGARWDDVAAQNIDAFTSGLLPGIDRVAEGALTTAASMFIPTLEPKKQITKLPNSYQVFMHRTGLDEYMVEDDEGVLRLDDTMQSQLMGIASAHPMIQEMIRHYGEVDNPGFAQNPLMGVVEAMVRASGLVSISPQDTIKSREGQIYHQQHQLRALLARERKRVKDFD